jgi:hypothetical protein
MTAQPQAAPDVNDVLMGGNDGPSAPFLKMGPATASRPQHTAPGEWKGGRIVALRPVQAHKLGAPDRQTGKPTRIPQVLRFGPEGRGNRSGIVLLILQTTERDPQIEGDDGLRQIQLSGFDRYWEATADFDCTKRAARLAVTAAGATGIEVGGEYFQAWTHQVPITGASQPAIHWVARYVPPGQSFTFEQPQAQQTPAQGFNLGQVAQQAVTQQAPQAPAQAPTQPAFANYPPQPGQPTGPNGWGQPQAPAQPPAPQAQAPAQPPVEPPF